MFLCDQLVGKHRMKWRVEQNMNKGVRVFSEKFIWVYLHPIKGTKIKWNTSALSHRPALSRRRKTHLFLAPTLQYCWIGITTPCQQVTNY